MEAFPRFALHPGDGCGNRLLLVQGPELDALERRIRQMQIEQAGLEAEGGKDAKAKIDALQADMAEAEAIVDASNRTPITNDTITERSAVMARIKEAREKGYGIGVGQALTTRRNQHHHDRDGLQHGQSQ